MRVPPIPVTVAGYQSDRQVCETILQSLDFLLHTQWRIVVATRSNSYLTRAKTTDSHRGPQQPDGTFTVP